MKFHNNYLYTGCDDKKIRVYSWPEVNEVEELPGHDDGVAPVHSLKFLLVGHLTSAAVYALPMASHQTPMITLVNSKSGTCNDGCDCGDTPTK